MPEGQQSITAPSAVVGCGCQTTEPRHKGQLLARCPGPTHSSECEEYVDFRTFRDRWRGQTGQSFCVACALRRRPPELPRGATTASGTDIDVTTHHSYHCIPLLVAGTRRLGDLDLQPALSHFDRTERRFPEYRSRSDPASVQQPPSRFVCQAKAGQNQVVCSLAAFWQAFLVDIRKNSLQTVWLGDVGRPLFHFVKNYSDRTRRRSR